MKQALIKHLIIYTAIIAIVILVPLSIVRYKLHTTTTKILPHSVDSFMTGIHGKQFNDLGALQDTLVSPKIVGYSKPTAITAIKPNLVVAGQLGSNWHISADHGKIINDSQIVDLWQKVKIIQPPGKNSHNITILTSRIRYYAKKKVAITDKPVTIIRPKIVVYGVGMTINIKTGLISLLHQVRGQYNRTLIKQSLYDNNKTAKVTK